VKSILQAAAKSNVKRIVITSSFASVIDVNRKAPPFFTYTGEDWNPLTYAEAIAPETSAVVAYRGSKKFAELEAWKFIVKENPGFDIVALCPPMTFGPVVHPVTSAKELNESNAGLWKIACGAGPLPLARVPFWVDVRDLAEAHVEALLRSGASNKRFIPAAPERFSYSLAAQIMLEEFPWAMDKVSAEPNQAIENSHAVDGAAVTEALGVKYRAFKETVIDLISQISLMEKHE